LRFRVPFAALVALSLLLTGGPAAAAPEVKLPFAGGTRAAIIQGYNAVTHTGVERFSLDLVVLEGETAGAPVLTPAAGRIAWADAPGSGPGCFAVDIRDGDGLSVMVCHLVLDRPLARGETVERGQRVGVVGAAGRVANNGMPHLHIQLYRGPTGGPTRTPLPFAASGGAPLDGTNLPADGSPNQWACTTLPRCTAIVSTNAAAGPAPSGAPSAPPAARPATTGAPTGSPGPAPAGGTQYVRGTGSCLNVREAPAATAAVLRCLPEGAEVRVRSESREVEGRRWVRLEGDGWVAAEFLSNEAPPPGTAPAAEASVPPAPKKPRTAVVTSGDDCLNVRSEPDISAKVLRCLADGTEVRLADETREAAGRVWQRLEEEGWAVSEYLRTKDE
jgi:murein DD-endopeptidase MepM/ murein hydrolase activator NlpD